MTAPYFLFCVANTVKSYFWGFIFLTECEATRLQKQNLNDTSWGEGCRSSFKQIGPAPPPPWLESLWWSGQFLWEIRELWAWAFYYRSCLYVSVDATIAQQLCKRIRNELDDQGSPQHTAHSPKCVHSGMKVKKHFQSTDLVLCKIINAHF